METAKAPTTPSMLMLPLPLLLLLWVLLCGTALGSPLPDHELKMLEMMRNILGVDSSSMTDSRSQRSMAFASSVPYEDSLPEEASDSMRLFEEELDDSDECGDFSCLRGEPRPTSSNMDLELLPCPRPLLPMDHPCFVRVIVLRTPLLRHDPCKNFTMTTTTTTTKPPKVRKCKPKLKATQTQNTTTTTTRTTVATTGNESSEETDPPTTEDTTPALSSSTPTSTTTEEPSTTTEISTTTLAQTTSTTTKPLPSTTIPYSHYHQLKSLRARLRKKKRPSVPDTPKIKLDGAMQSSDTFPVFQTTEVGELILRPETTEPECEPETETETTTTPAPVDCVEDASEVEVTVEDDKSKAKASEKTAEGDSTAASEDYDAQDQNTNLCPQFSNPDDPVAANMRLAPSSRYRKTGKNYVEPILYEGQIGKPRHSNGLVPQQRRDYYVSNKQIMPKPRPRYRAPLPHSIYMNNIVRGVKCTDEVGNPVHPLHALHSLQPRRYRAGKLIPRGVWINRRHGAPGEYVAMGPHRQGHGNPRSRPNPLYGLSSGEDIDPYGGESGSYYDDGSGEPLTWSREKVGHGGSSPNTDPCAAELRQERSRERERESDGDRESEQLMEHVEPRFFT